jgi:hypothetical protein
VAFWFKIFINMKVKNIGLIGFLCAYIIACKENSTVVNSITTEDLNYANQIQKLFANYGAKNVSTSIEGNFLVVKSDAVPDHKSPYFASNDAKFEKYNGNNAQYQQNPNSLVAQTLTFRIPLNPKEATSKSATPLGPIGVSLNGIPFFNQYAGPNQPLTFEINSIDQYGGHPQQTGQYHYHLEPFYLTKTKGKDAFLGILLDGFPVYGPLENGKIIMNADLDAFHGHNSKTADFPNGIYHYHITDADPYLNGSGFFGIAGTISR